MKLLAILGPLKWIPPFIGVLALSLFSFTGIGGGSDYKLTAPFDTASGLFPGSDVLIAGSKAGTIDNIYLKGDLAMVTFTVDAAHTPVHSDATVQLRPKSLLGEKYIALDPGTTGNSLASGTILSPTRVTRSVDLEEVLNSLDAPTREKLRTVIYELGGGVAGQGKQTNETFTYGTQDMNDLAAISQTLQKRDSDLQEVIRALDAVLSELSTPDRRASLGQLIVNTQRMMKTLADEDGTLQRALVETNAALARTDTAFSGTAPNLAHILRTTPTLIHNVNLLTADFGSGLDTLLKPCPTAECSRWSADSGNGKSLFAQLLVGIDRGDVVFGGRDANGYATRIAVLVDGNSAGPGALDCTKLPDPLKAICGLITSGQLPVISTKSNQIFMPNGGDTVVSGGSSPPATTTSSGSTSTASPTNSSGSGDGLYNFLIGATK